MLHYLDEQLANLDENEQAGVHWLVRGLEDYRRQKQHELDAFLRKLDDEKLERRLKACVREGTSA